MSGARGGLVEQEISASIATVTALVLSILDLPANREILSSRLSLRVRSPYGTNVTVNSILSLSPISSSQAEYRYEQDLPAISLGM